jgi:hypothetical protein
MARRPSLIKLKQKKQKQSKTEQYLINRKYCGEEPTYTSAELTATKHHSVLGWYNYMCDLKEAKEYLQTYLKNAGRDAELKKLREVPDKWYSTTACWNARIMSQGGKLSEASKRFFETRLAEMLNRDYSKAGHIGAFPEEVVVVRPSVERTVQDRVRVILDEQISIIEAEIDAFGDNNVSNPDYVSPFKMYDWLQGKEVSAANAKNMHEFYNPQLEEIEEAYCGIVLKQAADEQIKEGYSSYSKEQLKKLFGFYVMIVEDLEQYMSNSKKERKPRVKKPVSAEKKLKDFKYMEFDNTKKIQSVQPVRILGASELWAFNTKYNQLTVLRASGSTTLDVHRTAIINFDPTQSETKKLKAKDVESILKQVSDSGKVALRSIMKNARGSTQKLQERMNENTLLLRVVS